MKKRVWNYLMALCLSMIAVIFLSGDTKIYAVEGSGMSYDPYIATTYTELHNLLYLNKDCYIELGNNIDFSENVSGYGLTIRKGTKKYLDLKGYNITRYLYTYDFYLFDIEEGAVFQLKNTNTLSESKIKVENSKYRTGVLNNNGGTLYLNDMGCGEISMDFLGVTDHRAIYCIKSANGSVNIFDGVTIGGSSSTAYDTYSSNTSTCFYSDHDKSVKINGSVFCSGVIITAAEAEINKTVICGGFNDTYVCQIPDSSIGANSKLTQLSSVVTPEYYYNESDNRQYLMVPRNLDVPNYQVTKIEWKSDPAVVNDPSPAYAICTGSDSMTFVCDGLYYDSCTWFITDASGNTDSWSTASNYCTVKGKNTCRLTITPMEDKDWLNGKYVYCRLTNEKGSTFSNKALITISKPETMQILRQPSDREGVVGDLLRFTVNATGVDSYQWYVTDVGDEQYYSWSTVYQHATFDTTTDNVLELVPTDTWLDYKSVCCELYKNDKYLGRTEFANIHVEPAYETITNISIDGLEEPVVGKYPDTTLGVGGNSEAGIQYTVTWYRNESGLLKPISTDQPFEAGVRYYARATLYPMDDAVFAYYEETDEYQEVYQVYDGTVSINGAKYDEKCYLNNGNLNVKLWNQTAAEAYRILSNPSSETCDVNEEISFDIEAEGVSGYQWQICDSDDDRQPYSWSTVLKHASCSSTSESRITIRPLDTWLDGKAIFCELYNANGRYMGESDTASIRVYPAEEKLQKITSVEITGLEDPVIGNEPDITIAVDDNCHAGMQYTVAWYRNDSGRLTPISDGELFESGVRYLATITLYPVDGTAFAYYEETDDNEETNQVYDGTVTINDEAFGSKCYLINGNLRISWWNQEAMEVIAPHIHKYETVITKATLTKNGKIETKCSCGDVSTTKTIYRPENFKMSAYNYVYDGSVKTPTLTIKDTNGKTIAASNYTLTKASGRKNVGMYIYTVKFKGNYSGTNKINFQIIPKATSLTTLTAKSKAFTVGWKKQTTQTTGYLLQYATKSNFANQVSVKITKNTTVSKPITKLKAKKKYYVRIQTYKVVNGRYIYSKWSPVKYVTTKS